MPNFHARRDRLRRVLRREKVDALLVTNFTNVTYLTGFTGDDSFLLVTLDDALLVTDMRYDDQLGEECPDLPLMVRGPGDRMAPAVAGAIADAGIERLGVEAAAMTLALQASLAKQASSLEMHPIDSAVEGLRLVKDKDEIDEIRLAAYQARKAFDVIRAGLTPEATENQVAADLEYQARRFGAKGLSFPPIVAVGPRGALPHATPTDRKIGASDFTLIDWGANAGLYVSDLTRMVITGKVSARFRKLYDLVLEAQKAAIEAIKPGVLCKDVDAVARDIITAGGHGKRFGHGLGHGIGLEVHEGPRLSSSDDTKLKAGMVVTVEPGVYLPGWGGIRIEDDVLVTSNGYELLTDVPKELDDCVVA